jgi:hypothetical protein
MTASHTRARLRKSRQDYNRTLLSPEQKKDNPQASKQYIIFGGRIGHRTGTPFREFIRRFPEGGPPAKTPLRKLFSQAAAIRKFFAEKRARRKEAKRRSKQRPYRFIGQKQSKPASLK